MTPTQRAALEYVGQHQPVYLAQHFKVSTIRVLLKRDLIANTNRSPSFATAKYRLTHKGRRALTGGTGNGA